MRNNAIWGKAPLKAYTLLLGGILPLLGGCDAIVNGSNATAEVTGNAFRDMASTWNDAFTYHGQPKPNQPQTRYCYRMSSDIVCYDSLQPSLTAQLAGYQDGSHMSWIQPGGGSLGASGGDPVAYQTSPVSATPVIRARTALQAQPLEVGSISSGEIQTLDLPAR